MLVIAFVLYVQFYFDEIISLTGFKPYPMTHARLINYDVQINVIIMLEQKLQNNSYHHSRRTGNCFKASIHSSIEFGPRNARKFLLAGCW